MDALSDEIAALKARVAVLTTENARLLDENREGSEQRKALEAALQAARSAGDRPSTLQSSNAAKAGARPSAATAVVPPPEARRGSQRQQCPKGGRWTPPGQVRMCGCRHRVS